MQIQTKPLTPQSQRFLSSTCEDSPQIKLHKYRHFLSTRRQSAQDLSQQLLFYALQNNLIGQYDLIYDMLNLSLQKPQIYKHQRQQLITATNPVRQQLEHAQSISGYEQSVQLNYKLAIYYRSCGMHKQSANYFNKLFRLQSLSTKTIYSRSQYFSLWAQELYFDNNYHELGIFLRNEVQDDKKADVNLLLIKDLKYIQMEKSNNTQFFSNLFTISSPSDITNNTIISLHDLGFLYSLVLIAKKDRSLIKKKVSWSSNIEVLYLQNHTIQLLNSLHQFYVQQGIFHPLIDKLYPKFIQLIKQRVLTEYLTAYTSLSLKDIELHTTIKQGELLQFLHQHPQLPYLIDPVTQSLVYYEKSIPLYEQTMEFGHKLRGKWKDMIKACLTARKNQDSQILQTNFTNNQQQGFRAIFADRQRGEYDQ